MALSVSSTRPEEYPRGPAVPRVKELEARLAALQARHALECRPLEEQLQAEGLGWFARHRLGGDLEELHARQGKEVEDLRRSLERGVEGSTGTVRVVLSGVSAVFAQTVLHPVETTKVRLQNDYGANRRYGNFLRGTYIILKEEGLFHGLYKGMAPSAMRELLYSSLRFGLYVPMKQLLGETDPKATPLWKKFASGGLAAAIGSALANPTDLLKARMQADTCMPPTTLTAHVREIYHDGGVLGFWKGTSTTVVRAIILGAVKLGSYDECKKQFHQLGLRGVLCQFVASATTGVLTVAASAPADFTRTRIMAAKQLAQQSGVEVQYSGPIDVLYQTVKYEGVTALWRGAVPQWLRIGPYTIIQFIVWQRLCKMCGTNAV